MKRRTALLTLSAAAWPQWANAADAPVLSDDALAALLRRGGCVVMMRHAQTEPGIGDPPEFTLGQCSTQRNLSAQGQVQARRVGDWFTSLGLQPRQVQSSQWCRCQDTARLAFGHFTELPALNSSFETPNRQPAQTAQLRQRLQAIPAGQFDVWVTHQVNMTDLIQAWPAMGEIFVLDGPARLRARRTL